MLLRDEIATYLEGAFDASPLQAQRVADYILALPEMAEALNLAETWEERLLDESEASRFDAEHNSW